MGRLTPMVGWGIFAMDIYQNREFLKATISQGARDFYDYQERALAGERYANGWPIPIVCSGKGTLVLTPKGLITIEKIKKHDVVYSYNLKNKKFRKSTVTKLYKRIATKIYTIKTDSSSIKVTGEHPFL